MALSAFGLIRDSKFSYTSKSIIACRVSVVGEGWLFAMLAISAPHAITPNGRSFKEQPPPPTHNLVA